MIRARAHRFEDGKEEISNLFFLRGYPGEPGSRAGRAESSDAASTVKKHDAHFHEKYLWDQLRPIIPSPTGRFFGGLLSQALRAWLRSCCPSGTKYILSAEALTKLELMG